MKNFIPVIFFLIAFEQKVFTRRLANVIDDNAILYAQSYFSKPYSISNGDGRLYQTWELEDHDTLDDNENDHRIIFPERGSRTTTRVSQRQTRQCLTSCQPTAEYELVCGTDGVIYQNLEQLQCFMRCGVDVNIHHLAPCSGWGGTTASPIQTSTSTNLQACMSSCPTTSEYSPVCGSDHITYYNHGKMACAQWCGKDVQLIRRTPCPKITTTANNVITTTPRSTTISISARTCITSCPSTPEYNPVCGTDRQTYFNLSRLQCAINCGVDVSLLKSVACHLEENSAISNKPNDDDNYDIDIRFHKD
ncbi:jg24911 [Pararge aegeria aegeria]|uniref:Jg24911 protein n=1 Tax=Pararge aegeria aegeria TaxID=348720 RepID=A0A8S4R2B5_9NEOP|nr:jg24911 [Pararge aegeria aegeria]